MISLTQSELKSKIEERLLARIDEIENSSVQQAMKYSLMAKGKRLRPLFVLNVLMGYGQDPCLGLDAACALEMIHTYSLIHDDLPAMDDDDYRRGNLTCHKKFDEATAILAGDGLLTQAFYLSAGCSSDMKKNMEITKILARSAGAQGMIYGQELDIQSESMTSLNFDDLKKIHLNKTGRLFSAALMIGCILSSKEEKLPLWEKIGHHVGLAFQIQDDILDVTSTQSELGKSTSDVANGKFTTVTLFGLDRAKELMKEEYQKAIDLMKECDFDDSQMKACLQSLIIRKF